MRDNLMAYEHLGTLAKAGGPPPSRPLDQIGMLADRAENMAAILCGFIDRFNGRGMSGEASAQTRPSPAGHAGQLQRLDDALALIGKLTEELCSIG